MNKTFLARLRNAAVLLSAAAVLHMVDACSQGGSTVHSATAGTGGGGAMSTGSGACTCTQPSVTTITEPCKPADATHSLPYAEHDFPGVPVANLGRIISVINYTAPVSGSFTGGTGSVLLKDGAVMGICQPSFASFTFIIPNLD